MIIDLIFGIVFLVLGLAVILLINDKINKIFKWFAITIAILSLLCSAGAFSRYFSPQEQLMRPTYQPNERIQSV